MKTPHVRVDDSAGIVQIIAADGKVLLTLAKFAWSFLLANPVKGKIS